MSNRISAPQARLKATEGSAALDAFFEGVEEAVAQQHHSFYFRGELSESDLAYLRDEMGYTVEWNRPCSWWDVSF